MIAIPLFLFVVYLGLFLNGILNQGLPECQGVISTIVGIFGMTVLTIALLARFFAH